MDYSAASRHGRIRTGDPRRRFVELVGAIVVIGLAGLLQGCSIQNLAVDALADSLAASADVYAADEDPELVRDALPFALKTIEGLLVEKPDHRGLLLSACSGFTGYANAFVQVDAERLEGIDYRDSERQYARALALYLRARDYCFRSLELGWPGIAPNRGNQTFCQ